jgi:hypothetical protein
MDLKSLMIDSKASWVDFEGLDGFSVEVVNLSRKELANLRKSCVTQKFERSSREKVEILNEEKFVREFTKKVVKNWKGLTLENLSQLMLIDTAGMDPEQEVEYSQENAQQLVENSTEFDTWLNEVIFDLDNFRN